MPRGIRKKTTVEVVGEKSKVETPILPETQVQEKASSARIAKIYKNKAEEMKAFLAEQPKVSFIVPLMPGESPNATESVNMNGYKLTIKKGVMVELPRSVVKLLADHYRIAMSDMTDLGRTKLVDRATESQKALE